MSTEDWQLNQILAYLAADLPDTRWIVLLGKHSTVKASFPNSVIETDRVSAMGAALLSLGERISRELSGGQLQYSLIAGETGSHAVIVLNHEYLLMLGLRTAASSDTVLTALQRSLIPLLQALKIEQLPRWLAKWS